jgi:peptidoglycan/LPS O-acetylase OafA/YrhL
LAYLLLRPGSAASRLLSTGAFGWMGRLSYSLYLWQQLFLAPEGAGLGAARSFPVNVLCLGAAAWLSYTLVERPFLRLKERFAAKPSQLRRGQPSGVVS